MRVQHSNDDPCSSKVFIFILHDEAAYPLIAGTCAKGGGEGKIRSELDP